MYNIVEVISRNVHGTLYQINLSSASNLHKTVIHKDSHSKNELFFTFPSRFQFVAICFVFDHWFLQDHYSNGKWHWMQNDHERKLSLKVPIDIEEREVIWEIGIPLINDIILLYFISTVYFLENKVNTIFWKRQIWKTESKGIK